jgi:hypothetical protein
MKHLLIAGMVAGVLLAAAGCGQPAAPQGPASYLAVSGSKVAFIQWRTASRRDLHGTITEGGVGGSGPAQALSLSSAPFTGSLGGHSVRLAFGSLYFLRTHAHGTLGGSALTMTVPQSDGTVKLVTFRRASQADYGRAIASLRTRIRHATSLAARQQASQDGSSHAQAEQSTQRTLNALYSDSSIALGSKLADGVSRLAVTTGVAQAHLAKEKADAAGDDKYCVHAFKATGDALTIGGVQQNAQGAVSYLMPEITAIRQGVAAATAGLRHLSKAGLPPPSLASNVIADARASIRQVIVTANSYISQVNTIESRARSLADSAASGKCSGARSGSSSHPIPPIGGASGKSG